jgi:hypothetical protein
MCIKFKTIIQRVYDVEVEYELVLHARIPTWVVGNRTECAKCKIVADSPMNALSFEDSLVHPDKECVVARTSGHDQFVFHTRCWDVLREKNKEK